MWCCMFVVLVEVLTEETCRGGDEINYTVHFLLHVHDVCLDIQYYTVYIHVHTAVYV